MSRISIQEFAERLAERKGMSVSDAQQFLTAMLDTINDGLKDDKTVKVKGLGTFKVIDVKQRKSVDVNTGEEIIIEGRGKITFTPDSIMKDLVNKPFSQFETVVLNEGVDFSEIDSIEGEDEEPTDDVEITENEEQHEEIIETKADEVPPIAAIMGSARLCSCWITSTEKRCRKKHLQKSRRKRALMRRMRPSPMPCSWCTRLMRKRRR